MSKKFKGLRAMNLVYLKYGLFFTLILGICVILVVELYFYFDFDDRIQDVYKFEPLQEFTKKYLTSMDMIMLRILNLSIEFSTSVFSRIIAKDGVTEDDELSEVTLSDDFIETNDQMTEIAYQSLSQFLDTIIAQSLKGVNVNEHYASFTKKITPITFCLQNVSYINRTEHVMIYQLVIYTLTQMRFLIRNPEIEFWEQKTEYCEIFLSYHPIVSSINLVYGELVNVDQREFLESKRSILIFTLVVSILFLLITLPCLIVLSVFAAREPSNLLNLMQKIDLKSRIEASSSIIPEKNESFNEESNDSLPTFGTLSLF
jgi:hypothetical protein